MDFDFIALECALERDDGLDQERVGIFEVQMHNSHHSNAHQLCLEQSLHLLEIVFVDGGGDELGLFGGSHLGLIDVFESCHVLLLVDQVLCIEVDTGDDDIRENVDSADEVQYRGVFERNSFRDLHHPKDNDQVCYLGRDSHLEGAMMMKIRSSRRDEEVLCKNRRGRN